MNDILVLTVVLTSLEERNIKDDSTRRRINAVRKEIEKRADYIADELINNLTNLK